MMMIVYDLTNLAASDVESTNLAKQCRFLECAYGTNFMDNILNDSDIPMRSLKQEIIKVDFSLTQKQAKDHQSQKYVRDIALNGGWMRVWDAALDQGPSGTITSLAILKLLCKTTFADRRCPVEYCAYVLPADSSLSDHFLMQLAY